MPAAPADNALYRGLFHDEDTARLFTETAEVRAMLLVEGALAKVQGALGIIPAESAAFLHRACMEVHIDPSSLAAETGANGVPVPALVAAFRKASNAPEHAQFLHWGATSQDIMDSALALRLKPVFDLWEARLTELLHALATLAQTHAALPMAARTYGQIATPTSFGAVVAAWGWPLLAYRDQMAAQREALLQVSLSGAAGTLSAMGEQGPAVRAGLAAALGLRDPGHSWHTDRSGVTGFAAWMTGLMGCLGKIGEDLILLVQSGLAEVHIDGGGASSTMPQKQNPVGPSVLVALARHSIGLGANLQGAALHRQQRDGAAWFTEWLTLPQLCINAGRGLATAIDIVARLKPDASAMAAAKDDVGGLIHAEVLTFILAKTLPRPQAQAAIKDLCQQARAKSVQLEQLFAQAYPSIDLSTALTGDAALGQAPTDARAFAAHVDGGLA
jgi:3-carboxy-cis,cis-muconate cycloisomerase